MTYDYKSSACPEYEALLEDSISGEIGGADGTRLSEHLKSCSGCREAREHVALTPRLLHLAEGTADPGTGFSRDVMARIRTDRDVRSERGFWQPLVSMSWRFAATATLALAFLVAYDTTSHVQQAGSADAHARSIVQNPRYVFSRSSARSQQSRRSSDDDGGRR